MKDLKSQITANFKRKENVMELFECKGICDRCILSSKECPMKDKLDMPTGGGEDSLKNFIDRTFLAEKNVLIKELLKPEIVIAQLCDDGLFNLIEGMIAVNNIHTVSHVQIEQKIIGLIPENITAHFKDENHPITKRLLRVINIVVERVLLMINNKCGQDECSECWLKEKCS